MGIVLSLVLSSSSASSPFSASSFQKNGCESEKDDRSSGGGSGDGGMFSPRKKISCAAGTTPIKLKPAKKHAGSEDSESKEGAPKPSSAPCCRNSLIFSARLKFSSGGGSCDGGNGRGAVEQRASD